MQLQARFIDEIKYHFLCADRAFFIQRYRHPHMLSWHPVNVNMFPALSMYLAMHDYKFYNLNSRRHHTARAVMTSYRSQTETGQRAQSVLLHVYSLVADAMTHERLIHNVMQSVHIL